MSRRCLHFALVVLIGSTSAAFGEDVPNPSFDAPAASKGNDAKSVVPARGQRAIGNKNVPWNGTRPAPKAPAAARTAQAKPIPPAPAERQFDPNARPIAPKLGAPDVQKAFALTKTAETEEVFTQIIGLCKSGLDKGLDTKMVAYARQLSAWAHNRRGEVRADAGNTQEAFKDFDAAVSLDARQWRAVHNRGVSYAMLGNQSAAIADFTRAIELNPKFANAWFNRGELLYEKRDFASALRDYNQVVKLSPQDAAAFNSRGHALYRLQRYADALADYNKALEIDPSSAAALVNRGDLQSDQGNFADAAKDYRAAIKANPALGRAYQSAAWLMATCPDEKFRNSELAIEAAQKAIEIDGDSDYRYLETLAAAQANAGEFDNAITTQQRAIENAPTAVAQVYKGRVEKFRARQPHREPSAKFASGSATAARR
jgi:tetratricopeptide (TPR) repeat protein